MNEPCDFHKGLVDEIIRFNKEHTDAMKTIREDVTEIKEALIGTLDSQGLIGRVSAQTVEINRNISDLQEWQDEKKEEIKTFTGKVFSWVGGAIFATSAAMVALFKWIIP